MRNKIIKAMGITGLAAMAMVSAPGAANASTSVDYASLPSTQQASVINALNMAPIDVGGQTFKVNDPSGTPCFGVYAGRITYDPVTGRITKIETATVEFYQSVAACLI